MTLARGRAARLRVLASHTPTQVVVAAFALAVLTGTALLLLPIARAGTGGAPLLTALFTAASAVCITGLIVVDTPSYWSGFGEVVILGLVQIGGFGIMTAASLLGLVASRRLGLRSRLTAQAETNALGLGEVRRVIRTVAVFSLVFELATALLLAARWWLAYDESLPRAAYLGAFHSVSAFNNAGFALYRDSMVGFATDPWISLPLAVAVIAGGVGFPVLFELSRGLAKPRRWSLHTRLTLATSATLIAVGTVAVTALEWANAGTLGRLPVPGKLLAGFFQGVMPRSGGFNSVDYAQLDPATLIVTDVLMFIGGGSAGTSGGIKVTTFAILGMVIYAQVRGEADVNVLHRRVPTATQRQALTVALLAVGIVVSATIALLVATPFSLDQVLFEVVSAFGTTGLSTGITADLPGGGQLLLIALMFVGRLGTVTLASALALRERPLLHRLPEERPIVG